MNATRLQTLPAIEAALWRELGAATRERGHEWRVAVLATVEAGAAEARCVVLREVEAERRRVVFYSDARSPKVRQAENTPGATLVLWSRSLSWQLRLRVQLEVLTSGLTVSSRWARLKMTPGAQDYLSPLPPGHALGSEAAPLPERGTREHFAVVIAQIESIDWLELHAEGHRRAAFDATGARWLVP